MSKIEIIMRKFKRNNKEKSILFTLDESGQPLFVTSPIPYPVINDEEIIGLIKDFYQQVYELGNIEVTKREGWGVFYVALPGRTAEVTWTWVNAFSLEETPKK